MILVVNDDPTFLEKAREILNRDRRVFLASPATQAYELARTLGFSVALVDLDLPGDGLELIRKIHGTIPDLPIIAISSAFQRNELEGTEEDGVVEVLRKPITPEWKPVVERIRARRTST
jgi:CheY-like chemotaxis protein